MVTDNQYKVGDIVTAYIRGDLKVGIVTTMEPHNCRFTIIGPSIPKGAGYKGGWAIYYPPNDYSIGPADPKLLCLKNQRLFHDIPKQITTLFSKLRLNVIDNLPRFRETVLSLLDQIHDANLSDPCGTCRNCRDYQILLEGKPRIARPINPFLTHFGKTRDVL